MHVARRKLNFALILTLGDRFRRRNAPSNEPILTENLSMYLVDGTLLVPDACHRQSAGNNLLPVLDANGGKQFARLPAVPRLSALTGSAFFVIVVRPRR